MGVGDTIVVDQIIHFNGEEIGRGVIKALDHNRHYVSLGINGVGDFPAHLRLLLCLHAVL